MKVKIQTIDELVGIIIPPDVMQRYGWHVGDTLELRESDGGIELSGKNETLPDTVDFERQLRHARTAMRKYHTALSELAKS